MSDFDTWMPEVDPKQEALAAQQLAKLQSSVGVVDEVLEWLDASISFYGNTDSLGIDENTPDDQVKLALIIAKKMKIQFEQKANEFISTYAEYIQEDES